MKAVSLLAFASALQLSEAWNAVYFSKNNCKGQIITYENFTKQDSVCHQPIDPDMSARSVRIEGFSDGYYYSHDEEDDMDDDESYYYDYSDAKRIIRFYDTSDCVSTCEHRHVIAEKEYWNCVTWPLASKQGRKMKSFNIVEVGDLGMGRDHVPLSDGVCRLQHGDRLFYRDRYWKMQQVAATWFNEIPEEDWDPEIHLQNTEVRFGKHGDIDSFGKYKLLQDFRDYYLDEIPLEYWDDKKHSQWLPKLPDASFYKWAKIDLCEKATLDGADRELLLKKIPNADEMCKGWVNGRYKGEGFDTEQPMMIPLDHTHE